ncbi:MAG: hypothetical protein AAF616_12465 [Bacteroidota bacterium]
MAKKTASKQTILKGYQDFLLEHGKQPESVRVFTKFLGVEDEAFFKHFGSLKTVESSIWEGYFHQTMEVLQKDPDFEEMVSREKHLSYLYTLLEIIKSDRSYILMKLEGKKPNELPKELKKALNIITKSDNIDWAQGFSFLPDNAQDTLQSTYRRVLSAHVVSLLFFWVKDDTGEGKDTDIFIEKSTRTVFDIGELPALDSIFDLSKFFIQKMGFSRASA